MATFTNEERHLLEHIRDVTSPFFPRDFDFGKKENVLTLVKYWKGKGYCAPYRSDGGAQIGLYTQIRAKLGDPVPSKREVIERQERKNLDSMLKRVKESFDRKLNKIKQQYQMTKEEREDAINKHVLNITSQIAKLDEEKKELKRRQKNAENAVKRLEERKEEEENLKNEDHEPFENEPFENENGNLVRKCWNCGETFKLSGGEYNAHVKECSKGD